MPGGLPILGVWGLVGLCVVLPGVGVIMWLGMRMGDETGVTFCGDCVVAVAIVSVGAVGVAFWF